MPCLLVALSLAGCDGSCWRAPPGRAMPCLPTYLSGGNPCAGFRALLKSSRRQQQKQHLSLKPNALRLVEAPAAGLPLPALASRRSPSPPSPRSLFTDVSTEPPSKVGSGFRPARVVVVAKTTRYEFEQQRYRFAGLSEEDLKQLVSGGLPGTDRRLEVW